MTSGRCCGRGEGLRPTAACDSTTATSPAGRCRRAYVHGLGAVTLRSVAAELDVTAMALYRYVADKDELISLMVDAAFELDLSPTWPSVAHGAALVCP